MADIADLPVMSRADTVSLGFAGFNDVPHKAIDVPDGAFTITAKTSENRRVTFCFMGKSYDGPARFVDIQFHDRGTTIPNASDGVSPTFNAFAVTGRGRHVTDSRPLDEAHKPSILVLLMDEAGDEIGASRTLATAHERSRALKPAAASRDRDRRPGQRGPVGPRELDRHPPGRGREA
ncbi:hypothetical protein ACVOMT_23740 (plasmid) [Sphingomonas panni]